MKLFLILALVVCAAATPTPELVDVHETGVGLKLVSHDQNHDVFAVTVKRIDDLVDIDASGKSTEIGMKLSQVILTFDVDSETGALSCNSKPIPYGLSMVSVDADVTTGIKKDALKTMTEEQIKGAFDKGLVSVKISAEGQKVVLPNGLTIQRILIKEQIVELNGKEVSDSEIIQQVIELYPGGKIEKGEPSISSERELVGSMYPQLMEAGPRGPHSHGQHGHAHGHSKFSHRVARAAQWFRSQSGFVQFVTVMSMGTLLGLVSIALLQVFAILFLGVGFFSRRKRSTSVDGEKALLIEKSGEKEYLMQDHDELPGYQTTGFVENISKDVKE